MTTDQSSSKTLRITLRKSPIGFSKDQKRTVAALGLKKREQTVEQHETPAVRGMIEKVSHLVRVEEVDVRDDDVADAE